MSSAIGAWESEGGALDRVGSKAARVGRQYRTLWIGVLYAITIIAVLAVVAKLP